LSTRIFTILSGLALFGATFVPALTADEWNKKTTITIDEPVQMPTMVLQPGTYVFKLVESPSDRHIVQILSPDELHVFTTILAIPNYRLKPTSKSSFQFWETPAGQPKAMRAWFYPGDNFGQEFAYPKSRAVEIAKVTKAQVVTVATDKVEVEDLKVAPVVIVDEQGVETPVPGLVAQAAPPVQLESSSNPLPASLPHTASPLPLIALLGFGSLAIFGLMSRSSKRA
jgi:hypothetical protein